MGTVVRRSGEMADATVLKTVGGNPVRVRIPSPAPAQNAEKRPWVDLRDRSMGVSCSQVCSQSLGR